MKTEREYQAALVRLEQDLDGFVGAAFVDLGTGQTLAGYSVQPAFDQSAISGAARAAISAHLNLFQASGSQINPEEILVTVSGRLHLYQIVSDTVFLVLSADRTETNLALMRAAARQCSSRLSMKNDRPTMTPTLNSEVVS